MENILKIKIHLEDITDIAALKTLLGDNGFVAQHGNSEDADTMGVDVEVLTVVIPAVTGICASLTGIINSWLKNRTVEFEGLTC